jgi:hypothetical protein
MESKEWDKPQPTAHEVTEAEVCIQQLVPPTQKTIDSYKTDFLQPDFLQTDFQQN